MGIGTKIVTRAGPSVEIEGIRHKNNPTTVFNFEVADFHTYFVGKTNDGLWVHNDCLTDRISKGHAWGHVQAGDFAEGLGIVDAWGHQQKFADLINSVMRSPVFKRVDEGKDTARTYFLDEARRVVVIMWDRETGNGVYREFSTCYRVKTPNVWDHWDTIPDS